MFVRHLLCQRQAKPRPFSAAGDKGQEDALSECLRHTGTVVLDFQTQGEFAGTLTDQCMVFGTGTQDEVLRTGLHGIAHQIPQGLRESIRIGTHLRQARIVVAAQMHAITGLRLRQQAHALQCLMHVNLNHMGCTTRMQQPIDQTGETLGFMQDHLDVTPRVGILASPCEQLCGALDAGKRVAHFVRQTVQRGIQRIRQRVCIGGWKRIERMRLEQYAVIGTGEPEIGAMFRLGHEIQASVTHVYRRGAGILQADKLFGKMWRLRVEPIQMQAGKLARAGIEPAREGAVATTQHAIGIQPSQRCGEIFEIRCGQ